MSINFNVLQIKVELIIGLLPVHYFQKEDASMFLDSLHDSVDEDTQKLGKHEQGKNTIWR